MLRMPGWPHELLLETVATTRLLPVVRWRHHRRPARTNTTAFTNRCSLSSTARAYKHRASGGPPYKVLFAGSDTFSCLSLEALAKQDKDLVSDLHVLVGPDKRTSRGLRDTYRPPLRKQAEHLGLPVHVISSGGIKAWKPHAPFDEIDASHLLITASFGYLIPSTIMDLFSPLNALNLHPSLLPAYRGAAPIQWAIANDEAETGVTVQTLSRDRFDEGLILAQKKLPVPHSATYATLEHKLGHRGADLLVNVLKNLQHYQHQAQAQDDSLATKAPKVSSQTLHIDWPCWSGHDIERRHRAFGHQFALWTTLQGKRVQLLEVSVHEAAAAASSGQESSQSASEQEEDGQQQQHKANNQIEPISEQLAGRATFDKRTGCIDVACHDGSVLAVRTLKTEGRKALSAHEWWIGVAREQPFVRFGA